MRQLGYQVVDLVVERLQVRDQQPAVSSDSKASLESQLGTALPQAAGDPAAALQQLAEIALTHQQNGDHRRYFARVPGPASFAGILGDWLATGFNSMSASWTGSSGPTTLELTVTRWLADLLQLPPATEGILVSGGSLANLTAIGAARAAMGSGIVYLTDQTHSSILRGLRTLGFAADAIRILPSDQQMRMPVQELQNAVRQDVAEGRRPVLVIATAGTTNTGAVDPLADIADVCASDNMWLHVDGAYGAPAALCQRTRPAMRGLERADSVAIDPHKWLFQPYDIGCALVTRPGALEAAYSMNPEYLRDVLANPDEVDMRNRSLELSRRSRAVKLWLTFKTYGADRIRQGIDRGMDLAEFAQQVLSSLPDVWEVVTGAQLAIITFARKGATAADHQRAVQELTESGYAAVTSTTIHNRSVLRLCTINPLTTEEDIRETLKRLADLASAEGDP
jgi:glutamate/tyrosine decarboxylase-like PLP-dependent enzyme